MRNNKKYTFLLINLIAFNFLSGCAFYARCELGFNYHEICEETYWKTPCSWDGTIMKKEPKLTK